MGPDEKQQIEIWARKIKASDEAAFSALFHRFYPRLVKFSWQYTRTKTAAEDIVQESFVKLWQLRQRINPKQSLTAYLYQMVRNKSLNYLRDHPVHQASLADVPEQSLQTDQTEPDTFTGNNRLSEQMLQFIDALPDRQRQAICLSRFEGLDHDEIAYVMEISPRTVNNHIVKALGTLRDEWNAYKNDQP